MIKPASLGYESYKPIALQAHTDMVAEKALGVEHDFLNDPIEYFIDGDIVSTRGRTTLGADNGLGMAIILALFDDNTLKHPKLEGIFTSAEEEDFSGAANFDINLIQSKYLINLDCCNDNQIVCASAGGITFDGYKQLCYAELEGEFIDCKISISGFQGGHSGEDIHKGRGNTNILLFRLLHLLSDLDFYLLDISGGSFRLAIPRESSATIRISKKDSNSLEKLVEEFREILILEFPNSTDSIKIEIKETKSNKNPIKCKTFNDIKNYILTSPVDIQIMSNSFENLVDCSCNLGEIFIRDDKMVIISDIRASYDSQRDFIVEKLKIIAKTYGLDYKTYGEYYNWQYKKESKLRSLVESVYTKNNREQVEIVAVHAGLESGFFDHKKDGMDIVSLGPNSWNFHSPMEAFSISSLKYFYKNLIEILEFAKF